MLIQGDTLYLLCRGAERALADAVPGSEQFYELSDLVDGLRSRVAYYTRVQGEHGIKPPFVPDGP